MDTAGAGVSEDYGRSGVTGRSPQGGACGCLTAIAIIIPIFILYLMGDCVDDTCAEGKRAEAWIAVGAALLAGCAITWLFAQMGRNRD